MEETDSIPVVVIKRMPSADKECFVRQTKVDPKNKKYYHH
jgi:hypothetical protein